MMCEKLEKKILWHPFHENYAYVIIWHFACQVKIPADNILKYFSFIFLENKLWHFMQIVSLGDNIHDMSKPYFLNLHEMSKPIF